MKRICALMAAMLVLFSLAGCTENVFEAEDKVFAVDGMEITLTEGFKEKSREGYAAYFESSSVAVFVIKEEFSLAEGLGDVLLSDYAQAVFKTNSEHSPEPVYQYGGLTCMEYSYTNAGTAYRYFTTMFKGPDAFWLVQFSCREQSFEEYKPQFIEWAKTVSFSGAVSNEKVFSSNGMEITLTDDFKEASFEGYTVCYDSPSVAVFVLKEEFSLTEGLEDMTLSDYAQAVFESNSEHSPKPVYEKDGLTCMEYFYTNGEGVEYGYLSTMFKGPDAFWIVQFSCKADSFEDNKPQFVEWAKTVSFSD